MIKPVLYSVFLLFSVFSLKAQQNLVPNGSFEEYNCCPQFGGDISCANNWYSANYGTPDFFHPCGDLFFSVPANYFGYQIAKEGQSYAGFASGFGSGNSNIREYLQVELINPLKPNKNYYFSCYVSSGDSTSICLSQIGIAFSENPIESASSNPINYSPQIIYEQFICDFNNWNEISGVFLASGGEKYLTIGYFKDDTSSDTIIFNNNPVEDISYYYVDEVSLQEINSENDFPNVFTPNSDGINDVWTVSLIEEAEVIILDRWGNVVYEYKGNSPAWNGQEYSNGIFFYKIINTKGIKTGFIHLVR